VEVVKRFGVKNQTDETIVKKFNEETKTKGNTEVVFINKYKPWLTPKR
jgi:hypothetical protein